MFYVQIIIMSTIYLLLFTERSVVGAETTGLDVYVSFSLTKRERIKSNFFFFFGTKRDENVQFNL